MKKLACILTAILICLTASCALPFNESAGAEDLYLEEEMTEDEFSMDDMSEDLDAEYTDTSADEPETDPEASNPEGSTVPEPAVRWAYGVSLTALQSPYLLLVNQENLLDKGFIPEPLVKMNMVKRATSATVNLQETAAKAVEEMFAAALAVRSFTYTKLNSKGVEVEETVDYPNGMVLYLKSGYRSYSTQATTYSNYLARNNNVDDGYVAKPGASEHQSGLCCDILNKEYAGRDRMTQDFQYEPEAIWMKENCAEFGLILRYPQDQEDVTGIKFEPWHFRYVGQEIAGYISSSGLSLEEFTDQWQKEVEDFQKRGGDIQTQLTYEENVGNAPPASYILNELGEDGDAETSLVF